MNFEEQLQNLSQHFFGIARLTEFQVSAVQSACSGNNTAVYLPTGSGKTMCFWLVSFMKAYMNGLQESQITIIISPLVSLMKEQTSKLEQKGISAVYISAEQTQANVHKAKSGLFNFVYLTPEQSTTEDWKVSLRKLNSLKKIGLFVIDEVHSICQSSNSFRPEYQNLLTLIYQLSLPTLVLTATPTQEVRQLINSWFKEIQVIEGPLDRPEIFLEVVELKSKQKLPYDIIQEIINIDGLVLIFCNEKDSVRDLYDQLMSFSQLNGFVEMFHSDLTPGHKHFVIQQMNHSNVKVVVATSALGMGMDFQNIRWVILFGLPQNILDMVQQVGRACRDKLKGVATILFSKKQFNNEVDPRIMEFITSKSCKRAILLK